MNEPPSSPAGVFNRETMWQRFRDQTTPWDLAIIGGGATGIGIAVDAATRGCRTVLLEQSDFGKGTSSRSTKLVHGGVRYLQQGNLSLVREALKERGRLRRNAPHLVRNLPFIVPAYRWWEKPFYGIGLKLYDVLAGREGFGPSVLLSRREVLHRIPSLKPERLLGGVQYHDGQFDDSRLLINLVQTAADAGACLFNYAAVTRVLKDAGGSIAGLVFQDLESNVEHELQARCLINAAGPFCDAVRNLDDPGAAPMIAPSQGVHLVLDRAFLPGDHAIMVPRTPDGRVLFAIPWHGYALVGTTDGPIPKAMLEPKPTGVEIDFILETAGAYLARPPARADVLSAFAGIRPLVKAAQADRTALLSRDHTIQISPSRLLTITGGKWTTYRKMAEDAVDRALALAGLSARPCVTRDLPIHGHHRQAAQFGALAVYGSDAAGIRELTAEHPELKRPLHSSLPIIAAQVVWAVRHEMARTVDDVLARRTRALHLNARAARDMAPEVARIMASELRKDETWERAQGVAFATLAEGYLVEK